MNLYSKVAKSHKIRKSIGCNLKEMEMYINLRLFTPFSVFEYLFECIACAHDTSKALNIFGLLRIRQENQIHLLHFDGQFCPIALPKLCTKLIKLIGYSFARFTGHQIKNEYPLYQHR